MDQTKTSGSEHTGITLPKTFVTGLLGMVFALAFVVTPYWYMPETTGGRWAALLLTLVIGGIWIHLSAGSLQVKTDWRSLLLFMAILVVAVVLNYRALNYSLPWRGDEDFHIKMTLVFVSHLSFRWVIAGILGAGVFLYVLWRSPKIALVLGGMALAAAAAFVPSMITREPDFFFRYPIINYWAFSILPVLTSAFTHPYHEILYRVIPLLGAAAISWAFTKRMGVANRPSSYLWGIAILTVPTIFYYSSILYLELPAIFLMLVVCFNIEDLFRGNRETLKNNPAWYALILIGFIKETAATFLLCFIAIRLGMLLVQKVIPDIRTRTFQRKTLVHVLDEFLIGVAVFAPATLYVLMRSLFADIRSFSPDASPLLHPATYLAIARSFLEQFGVFLILFIIGVSQLMTRKKYLPAAFFMAVVVLISLFHAVDSGGIYTGYSRFNLTILPVILAGAFIVVENIPRQTSRMALLIPILLIAANLATSPILVDGSKKPLWGNYITDTSEHYYPYREAFVWLKETHPNSKLLIANENYPYFHSFYFNQLGWFPNYQISDFGSGSTGQEIAILTKKLEKAEQEGFSIVLFPFLERETNLPASINAFHLERVFQNDALKVLAVYTLK